MPTIDEIYASILGQQDPAAWQQAFSGLAPQVDEAAAANAHMDRIANAIASGPGGGGFQAIANEVQAQETANANNNRYGTDLSWLDPSFQMNPALLAQSARSQVYSDPAAAAAQDAALRRASQLAGQDLQTQGSGQQQGLMNQWAGIQAGQGAPQFMGGSQQQQLMQQLLGVQAPNFQGAGNNQQRVLDQALSAGSNTGPNALQFESPARQAEQYGNLQGIIAGGGATAIEMANRARQRADSESWLRGQREADMQDYAERGMSGSGMELLALSTDRQAAAGRNSLADLETAKALEERRLGAINSAAGLANTMRGQTADEQSLLNSRFFSGLGAAADVANSMRGANFQEQAFLNQSARDQALQAAGIAETMRNQGFQEQTYLDKRMLDALNQQTDLSGQMRDQTLAEQLGNRNAQLNATQQMGNLASDMRDASYTEAAGRASAADSFAQLNQAAINNANQLNSNFLQQSYQQMIDNRQQWEMNRLNQGLSTSQGLMGHDQRENQTGWNQGTQLGTANANQANNAQSNFNNALLGTAQQTGANVLNAQIAQNALYPQIGQTFGDFAGALGNMATSGGGAGYGSGGGAGGLSQPGTTWASSGNAGGTGATDWNELWKTVK